jgi:hypothetical protein
MHRRHRAALSLLLALASGTASADAPDGVEQEFLWQVNLARHDPGAWAQANGLGTLLDAFATKQPLAWNATLVDSAQAKAQEFIDHGYFAHQSPVTGSPNALIAVVHGYPLAGGSSSGYFYFGPGCDFGCSYAPNLGNSAVESLASSFAVDGGLTNTPIGAVRALLGEICSAEGTPNTCGTDGHRRHLLAAATLPAPMIESGVGHRFEIDGALTTHYWVFHTGFPASNQATMPQHLTGVVYADTDLDGHYDAGEGLAGVTVTANALGTVTNAAGGWSLDVANGSYDVVCTGGAFVSPASASGVVVADANRQVDCLLGEPHARVDFAPEPAALAAALAALGTLGLMARRRRGYDRRPCPT